MSDDVSQKKKRKRKDVEGDAENARKKPNRSSCKCSANEFILEQLQMVAEKRQTRAFGGRNVTNGMHLINNIKRAIVSVRDCEEPISSAEQAKTLKNIGSYIGNLIHSILLKRNGSCHAETDLHAQLINDQTPAPDCRREKEENTEYVRSCNIQQMSIDSSGSIYRPAKFKLPWYVLMGLWYKHSYQTDFAIEKKELITEMKQIGYTGEVTRVNSSIANLISSGVVGKAENNCLYLTAKGISSVEYLIEREPTPKKPRSGISFLNENTAAEVTSSIELANPHSTETNWPVLVESSDSNRKIDSQLNEPFSFVNEIIAKFVKHISNVHKVPITSTPDEEWEIVLLLDHREVLWKKNRSCFESKLLQLGVTCEVRSLNIGDFNWIAKRYTSIEGLTYIFALSQKFIDQVLGAEKIEEYALDMIVERKIVNDLAISIMDKRYIEQKHRLENCGLTSIVYLIEGSLAQLTSLSQPALETAMCQTQIQNNFLVQHCSTADESLRFLSRLHRILLQKFPLPTKLRNRVLDTVCSVNKSKSSHFPNLLFSDLNKNLKKKLFSVGEIHQMMLMQVPSFSSGKVSSIARQYTTFASLYAGFQKQYCQQDKDSMVEHFAFGLTKRKIGLKGSKTLSDVINFENY